MNSPYKIGVFDSGIGGLSVVNAIRKELPDVTVIFKNDAQHVPYGIRSSDDIHRLTLPILQQLVAQDCQVIVIACNTVTTNLIDKLRTELPVPLVGMEPMVKPAALATKTKVIAVCATPRTLTSHRYQWLKEKYASDITVLEPDCSEWSQMVENNSVDYDKIAKIVNKACTEGADQIVLGCTHYHWIEELIKQLAIGRAEVIQPEGAVLRQLKTVLERLP